MIKQLIHPSRFKVPLTADATAGTFTVSTTHASYIDTLRQAYSGTLRMLIIQPPTEAKPTTVYEHIIVSGINLSTGVCYTPTMTNYLEFSIASGTEVCCNLIPDGDMEYATAGCWKTTGVGTLSYTKSSIAYEGSQSLSISLSGGTSAGNKRIYNSIPCTQDEYFVFSVATKVVSGYDNSVGYLTSYWEGFSSVDFGQLVCSGTNDWYVHEGCTMYDYQGFDFDLEVGFITTTNNCAINLDNMILVPNLVYGGGFSLLADSSFWSNVNASGTQITSNTYSRESGLSGFDYITYFSANGYIQQSLNTIANTWYTFTGFIKKPPVWYDATYLYRVPLVVKSGYVSDDFTDFPIYVDLSLLPTSFHSHVKTNGADIRITKSDGITEVPREVVFYNESTDKGELHFKGDIYNLTDTIFYLYYGNSAASDYTTNAIYGAENVWTNNYHAVYHLQEDPSGNVAESIKDSTANSYDLSPSGGPTSVVGKLAGNAIAFAGTDDELVDANQVWLNSNNSITAQWWNYVTTANLSQHSVSFGFSKDGDANRIQCHSPWESDVYWDFGNILGAGRVSGAYTTFADQFAMIHCTSNGITQKRIFINGTKTYYNDSIADSPDNDRTGLTIGNSYGDATYFIGSIDEFRLSTVERTPAWITTEYANQSSPQTFFNTGSEEQNISQLCKITLTGQESSTVYYDSGWLVPTISAYDRVSSAFKNLTDSHLDIKVIGQSANGSVLLDSVSLVPLVEATDYTTTYSISDYYDFSKWYDNPTSSLLISGSSLFCVSIISGTNLNPNVGSIGLWYNPIYAYNEYTSDAVIVSGGGANTNFIRVYYNASDYKFYGEFYNGLEWVSSGCVSEEQVFVSGTWMHLAFSYDNTVGTKLFIDGSQVGEFYGTWVPQELSTLMTVGSISGSFGGRAEGFYDDIVFYAKSLNVSNWYQKTLQNGDYD